MAGIDDPLGARFHAGVVDLLGAGRARLEVGAALGPHPMANVRRGFDGHALAFEPIFVIRPRCADNVVVPDISFCPGLTLFGGCDMARVEWALWILCLTGVVQRARVVGVATVDGLSGRTPADGLTDEQTEVVRTRVRLMVQITARTATYRKGLLAAASRLSPQEASIVADLERHGLQVAQLHDVLCGGHVLVDDPQLYEDWRFAAVSHLCISSHHRDIDKKTYPDIGMRGPVVREKLHGRTAQGTWVQLEKTPAAFGSRRLPSWDDVRHLMDYVVYRITRSNVGPWGLSRLTERRPLYLSPAAVVPASLSASVAQVLMTALRRVAAAADSTAASADLAGRFPPPVPVDPVAELGRALSGRGGRGLFGNSDVWVTETASPVAAGLFRERREPPTAVLGASAS